jgi:hypothetical protein
MIFDRELVPGKFPHLFLRGKKFLRLHQLRTKVPSVARRNIDTSTYKLRAGGIGVVPNQFVITWALRM